jgi:Tfp pilus assembly protein PilX
MKHDEQGIALVITMFLMATLSALAVSMMFLAQTETASSRNYRTMSQARYAAEAGVHKSINYLLNSYSAPTVFTSYDLTKTPVTCISGCTYTNLTGACNPSTVATAVSTGCVVLSGMSGISSNYPDSTVASAFSTASQGTLAVNSSGTTTNAAAGTVTYGAAAILMSMRSVTAYGVTGTNVLQTWQIVSDGTVPPSTAAIVEVSGSLEREYGVAQTFAIFATGTGCGAISLQGTVQTASTSDGTTVVNSGGNVGTNGNMSIGGHVDVHGSLSSPRTGIGTCTNGSNVTALTTGGAATVDNNAVVQLPQALTFPTPSLPSPMPPVTSQSSAAAICAIVTPQGGLCTTSGTTATIDPIGNTISLGNISGDVVLKGGNYNINSIGSGNLSVGGAAGPAGTGTTNVVINLAGKTSTGTDLTNPFNLNAQAVVNSTNDASKLQILYAGTGTIDMTGGSQAAMLLYAPNASVVTHGNADIYGSLLVNNVTSAGTPRFIYDTRLQKQIVTLGNYMMTSFSWKKY